MNERIVFICLNILRYKTYIRNIYYIIMIYYTQLHKNVTVGLQGHNSKN